MINIINTKIVYKLVKNDIIKNNKIKKVKQYN